MRLSQTFDQLVDAWIAEHKDHRTETRPSLGWGFKELNRLCQEEPFAALRVIDQILEKDRSDPIMEVLAAGPLENRLVMHGTIVVEELLKIATSKEPFRELLGGVWSAGIDAEVWKKGRVFDLRLGKRRQQQSGQKAPPLFALNGCFHESIFDG